MIADDHCQMMARYNAWMNDKLFTLCADLPQAEPYRDRGAYFRSIYQMLNHIAYGNLAFLSRFTGTPAVVPELGLELFGGFAALHRERWALDDRMLDWARPLTPAWLVEPLIYTSKADGKSRALPRWVLVAHRFNQQTHHRGQITALLTQMDLDIGSTDIPFMPGFPYRVPSRMVRGNRDSHPAKMATLARRVLFPHETAAGTPCLRLAAANPSQPPASHHDAPGYCPA